MLASLRRLERFLVCQSRPGYARTHRRGLPGRNGRLAMDERKTLPDPFDLAQTVSDNGVPILAFTPLHAYLMGCADNWRLPDP